MKQVIKKAPASEQAPVKSTSPTETAATTVSGVSESTKHYPTGAELLEKAEKALQEEAKLDVTALENMTKGLITPRNQVDLPLRIWKLGRRQVPHDRS